MGIFCEINLFKPLDGTYQPGQTVSGLIKYAVDQPMEFSKITISFKGRGHVVMVKKGQKSDTTYSNSEVYVDIDDVIHDENILLPTGAYDTKFNFLIPQKIPSSTVFYKNWMNSYTLKINIRYYIRMKFEKRGGFFARNKHFRKDITVISGVTPKLLREPVMYGQTKKPMKLFSNKDNVINIKATILDSIIPSGGKIQLRVEVQNNSSALVKSVETKLIAVYKYHSSDAFKIPLPGIEVPDTDTKTSAVQCGNTQDMLIETNVPSDIHSLEHSNIVSREYLVLLVAALPVPHRNIKLTVPVQIGSIDEDREEYNMEERSDEISFGDPPPSYWEAMGETKTDDDDGSDDDDGYEKYTK